MNAEAKFVSSVMDARLKKVKRERDSFRKQRDELINDMAETKKKAKAFDEILNVDYIVTPDDYAHEITKIVDKYWEEQ
ncbi:hypothetical protein K4T82_06215 [Staphylococcus epidermidis]|uniref:Uncharacterized protein n=2 Tax=Rockefellervirus TaxID=2843445 RepID=A0A7U0J7U2_9CAUD|nr:MULTISPECIES: hypothetical protein [Staphylococcus]YP_009302079.1 hypothetical protein BJD82_gp61 [Staphylococcus phage CNPx]MBA9941289.1 hypothetical protein [Ralstonia insidiosa]QLF86476.1 hypothetical protein Phi456_00045 [Staphylococcus phage 456]QQV93341.1 hypothetical protein [Staphylococcus phage vB_SepS_456]AMM44623.1 hypothetical protein [Staphylococcus phage CNPx]KAB2305289.1 hypothetical protein F9B73_04805 [Staphylococcus epidermidis]